MTNFNIESQSYYCFSHTYAYVYVFLRLRQRMPKKLKSPTILQKQKYKYQSAIQTNTTPGHQKSQNQICENFTYTIFFFKSPKTIQTFAIPHS